MPDDKKMIEPLMGPYAGQRIEVDAADAEQAIADGWAKDPFAPPSDKPAPEIDQEKAAAAAAKAARKLRGEPDPSTGSGPASESETAAESIEERKAPAKKGK